MIMTKNQHDHSNYKEEGSAVMVKSFQDVRIAVYFYYTWQLTQLVTVCTQDSALVSSTVVNDYCLNCLIVSDVEFGRFYFNKI